jgi:hypothetical protein
MALVAVAARARAEFPPPVKDRDAFERFLRSRLRVRLSLEFRGKQESWERILYKWTRWTPSPAHENAASRAPV